MSQVVVYGRLEIIVNIFELLVPIRRIKYGMVCGDKDHWKIGLGSQVRSSYPLVWYYFGTALHLDWYYFAARLILLYDRTDAGVRAIYGPRKDAEGKNDEFRMIN
ncbi:hypothetical protein [Mariniradius sediminis]|uniref:Uncharacterized protein n=1 Tax=Mariniradius sediminis TaxID=2909237 RepID=A0ABS9BQJ4_9BACT|nr:hypothetical protein [Mariniradius sediminis]MCF1750324.1 hypothetical protein [Mariniradius sediminis]